MHRGVRLLAVLISCIFILVLSIFPAKISISIVSDLLSGKVNAYENENNNIANLIIQSNYLIAHAGGGIDGLKYTNSLEAVENSIINGFKMIELDLLTSLDGEIVAAHDWNHFHSITDSNQTNKISHFDFMRKKIYGTYHPLDIATATDKFNKNDIILITDKIQDLNNLSKHRLNKNRTVVEVFSIEKYNEAISLGFHNVALNIKIETLLIPDWLTLNGVKAVTYRGDNLYKNGLSHSNALKISKMGISSLIYSRDDLNLNIIRSYGLENFALYVDFMKPQ